MQELLRRGSSTCNRPRLGRKQKFPTMTVTRLRFARDSLLEGSGFELSVPPGLGSYRASTPTASQYSEPRNGRSFYGGTNSSNPLPSSGESGANLTSDWCGWKRSDDRWRLILLMSSTDHQLENLDRFAKEGLCRPSAAQRSPPRNRAVAEIVSVSCGRPEISTTRG